MRYFTASLIFECVFFCGLLCAQENVPSFTDVIQDPFFSSSVSTPPAQLGAFSSPEFGTNASLNPAVSTNPPVAPSVAIQPTPTLPQPTAPPRSAASKADLVYDVRITGNKQISAQEIVKLIKTRRGRPFSEPVLEEDKRALLQKGWFFNVIPRVEKTPHGYIVTFTFIENPLLHYVKINGNEAFTRQELMEQGQIQPGDALDAIAVHQAKERMIQYYQDSGFYRAHIEVLSGDKIGDRGAVFWVDEGPKQHILSTGFEGNSIASDEYLKTLIQSKPSRFFWIGSEFTKKKLDEDIAALTAYYRKLGFFYAKIDRKFEETQGYTGLGDNRAWVKVTFIIEEGPRCQIRDIRFEGNEFFTEEELKSVMKVTKKKDYNQDRLNLDINALKEKYGNEGFVFTQIEADPVIVDGYIDLGLRMYEGPQCYLRNMDVNIVGRDNMDSYSKIQTVLNRTTRLRPGELVRTSEIEATRRRLSYSRLFETNPANGAAPDFVMDFPDSVQKTYERDMAEAAAKKEAAKTAQAAATEQGTATPHTVFRPVFDPASETQAEAHEGQQNSQKPSANSETVFRGQARFAVPSRPAAPQSAMPYDVARQPAPISPAILQYTPPGLQNPPAAPLAVSSEQNAVKGNPIQQVSNQPTAGMYGVTTYNPNDSHSETTTTPRTVYAEPANISLAPQPIILQQTAAIYRGNPYYNDATEIRYDPVTGRKLYPLDGTWILQETQTGSFIMSVAVSSDSGLMGRFVIEEQNFDITRWPRGFRFNDWKNAFRGGGQRFRIEASPGTEVQRYSASWETPYFFDRDYSFGIDGYYYERYFDEWDEERLGGAVSFGKLWTPDFSTRVSLGAQQVNIYRPSYPTSQDLTDALGKHPMYTIGFDASHNTRDSEYMPTEGHLLSFNVEQVLGDYQFVRGGVDFRKYFMLHEKPDRSGRWVLGISSTLNVAEKGTPIYERYFGGGFANLRGFEYRGVTPRDANGAILGGAMEFYNSAELLFPLTADDMIRGSLFIDTGTVEKSISHWDSEYRVAAGFGLKLTIPMMGPVPLSFDFAFPINKESGDVTQVFSFSMGLGRL